MRFASTFLALLSIASVSWAQFGDSDLDLEQAQASIICMQRCGVEIAASSPSPLPGCRPSDQACNCNGLAVIKDSLNACFAKENCGDFDPFLKAICSPDAAPLWEYAFAGDDDDDETSVPGGNVVTTTNPAGNNVTPTSGESTTPVTGTSSVAAPPADNGGNGGASELLFNPALAGIAFAALLL